MKAELVPENGDPPIPIGRAVTLLGRHEDCHRPATVANHKLDCLHINFVDVGTLFTIDFYVDKICVHESGGFFVFKRFVGHDMAPVASRITNR